MVTWEYPISIYIPYFKNPTLNSQLSSHNAMLNQVTISWLTQLVFFLLQPSSWLVAAEGQALPSGQHVFLGAVWLCSYAQWSGFVMLHEVHLPFWHHHSNHHLVVSTHPKISQNIEFVIWGVIISNMVDNTRYSIQPTSHGSAMAFSENKGAPRSWLDIHG